MRTSDVFGDLPTIETDRLVLRRLSLDDDRDMYEYAADPLVARYVSWSHHRSIEDTRDFLRLVVGKHEDKTVAEWGLVHKRDRKLIGTCGYIWWQIANAKAEIGYSLSRRYWGQGLMPEAVQAAIRFGFETMQLNRIEATCMTENRASERVMRKCGMSFEGVLRETLFHRGRFVDLKLYSILIREWSVGSAGTPGGHLFGVAKPNPG